MGKAVYADIMAPGQPQGTVSGHLLLMTFASWRRFFLPFVFAGALFSWMDVCPTRLMCESGDAYVWRNFRCLASATRTSLRWVRRSLKLPAIRSPPRVSPRDDPKSLRFPPLLCPLSAPLPLPSFSLSAAQDIAASAWSSKSHGTSATCREMLLRVQHTASQIHRHGILKASPHLPGPRPTAASAVATFLRMVSTRSAS